MLVGGILCYVFRQRVQTTMQQEMLRTIRSYGDDRSITRAWDDLQEGVRPISFFNLPNFIYFTKKKKTIIPQSVEKYNFHIPTRG